MTTGTRTAGSFDVAVIGAGAAGMWTARSAADRGASVCLISRKPLAESSSFHAQGGLAAALEKDDSPAQHAADTMAAGRAMCSGDAVAILTEEAPDALDELIALGVEFDRRSDGELELGLEGGHSRRRIVHAGGSSTGREITAKLAASVASHPHITLLEETSATSLLSDGTACAGVATTDGGIHATATILATGGAAALWARTTNPWGSIGAGSVVAHAAGAELVDLEFCQFHPTAVRIPDSDLDGMLISEAVRGEGATLLDAGGRRFTDELGPRDAVTGAIIDRMRADGTESVDLDMSMIDGTSFPSIFARLHRHGIDPSLTPVPVAPAAHYMMGGVAVDTYGATSLPGLLAIGECACSGLHGANRLASNSLTECFVFGSRAAAVACELDPCQVANPAPWSFDPPTVATRNAMWELGGPVRTAAALEELADDPYPLAAMIARSALAREESRGGHRRIDRPALDPELDGMHLFHLPDGELEWRSWSTGPAGR